MIEILNAGESHGRALVGILSGMPSGLKVSVEKINHQTQRRRKGYGRSERMSIESDAVQILSGIRQGKTIGSPIALLIQNQDYRPDAPEIYQPRPGHADLVGILKYKQSMRNVLERASARHTAITVAAGTICRFLLEEFRILIAGSVIQIGNVIAGTEHLGFEELNKKTESSPVLCADEPATKKMIKQIDKAKQKGDTLGGIFEIRVIGLPPGLGSYVVPEKRLTSRLGAALFSIPAIKAVEFGELGFQCAGLPGSRVHDPIMWNKNKGYYRKTNNSGGLEGGMTTAEPLLIRACMKPISTLLNPLESVDIKTKKPVKAAVERSDICAVPAACVVAESYVAYILADAFLENFAGNSMEDVRTSYRSYMKRINQS